jgi:hypothetical protein
MDHMVAAAVYTYRHEAEAGQELLKANGIASVIQADDCGGARPFLAYPQGVSLLVNETELEKARSVLSPR